MISAKGSGKGAVGGATKGALNVTNKFGGGGLMKPVTMPGQKQQPRMLTTPLLGGNKPTLGFTAAVTNAAKLSANKPTVSAAGASKPAFSSAKPGMGVVKKILKTSPTPTVSPNTGAMPALASPSGMKGKLVASLQQRARLGMSVMSKLQQQQKPATSVPLAAAAKAMTAPTTLGSKGPTFTGIAKQLVLTEDTLRALSRERCSVGSISGTIVEVKGKVGWIKPTDEFEHEKSKLNGSKLFVLPDDVIGGDALEVGATVDFYVFETDKGLGAEECVVSSI